MITALHLIDYILFTLLTLSTAYLFVFALASRFSRPQPCFPACRLHRFAVIFPAYKEDKVIIQAVQSFLGQEYPAELYDLIVVSDHMLPETDEALGRLPLRLLKAGYENSSKAKALSLAMEATAGQPYDMVVIMDADNTTSPDFLSELNKAYGQGMKAIQTHRTAKNMNTDIAMLDAVSEEINNSIFRSGHVTLGLSSALIGSGMALDAAWFRQNVHRLQTAGEDKELEALLLKQGIHIGYLEEVYVEDEKTQKKEVIGSQRKRWLAAQFGSLFHALPDLLPALLQGNVDYLDKIVQWMLPPRVVLLAGITFFSLLTLILSPPASVKWWGLLAMLTVALLLAIPRKMINRRLLKAILQVPSMALMMISNLFRLRGANRHFIHTEKTYERHENSH